MSAAFHGAKLAILVGDRIVTILRDDTPSILWPNHWDLPGGGREANESPEDCVLRELREELGLIWQPTDLHWSVRSPAHHGFIWFFVAEKPDFDPTEVDFGDEGQEWRLASIDWFMREAKTLPRHRERLRQYFELSNRR